MPKNKITDYDDNPAGNTDAGGVNIAELCSFGNLNDAQRTVMAHIAAVSKGVHPVADTWSFADPADLTKKFRFDGGLVTAGQLRVITVPDVNGTMVLTGAQQVLTNKLLSNPFIVDPIDNTKAAGFIVSGFTTGTTRLFTLPNLSGFIMTAEVYPTLNTLESISFEFGDTLYASGPDTLVRLPRGTPGQQLTMNALGTFPEWKTPLGKFTSAQTALALIVNIPHGLGVKPRSFGAKLVCVIAQNGYAIGDEISIASGTIPSNNFVVVADATNITVASDSNTWRYLDRNTPTVNTLTNANWRLVVWADA